MTIELSASRTFSFELFPPKTEEGKAKLRATWQELAKLKPRFFSVTFGAGGSTQQGTLDTVLDIRESGQQAAPHISCVTASKEEIVKTLSRYREHGIRHIVALRGDMPSGLAAGGELRYANELVAFIRETTGDWFHIDVACYPEYHPQTRNPTDELKISSSRLTLVRILPLRNIFIMRTLTFALWTNVRLSASRFQSCRASCQSAIFPSSQGFPMLAERRSRAGFASNWKLIGTIPPPYALLALMSLRRCAKNC